MKNHEVTPAIKPLRDLQLAAADGYEGFDYLKVYELHELLHECLAALCADGPVAIFRGDKEPRSIELAAMSIRWFPDGRYRLQTGKLGTAKQSVGLPAHGPIPAIAVTMEKPDVSE